MLENQILVIGLESHEVERLNHIREDFIFIALPSLDHLKPHHLKLQGLIFRSDELDAVWNDLVNAFYGKCVVCITKTPSVASPMKTFGLNFRTEELEAYLLSQFDGVRAPPPDVGKIEIGTVVKNKIFPSWGIGVVTRVTGADVFEVHYPKIPKNLKTNLMTCHKSQLRIICDIKEIEHDKAY